MKGVRVDLEAVEKAERDLLDSLKANPEQAYVINYLAYSWIEQGVKIKKSLEMLKNKDLKNPWRKHGNIPL